MTFRLAIVVGHNARRQGADSPWLPPEYTFHVKQSGLIEQAAASAKGLAVKTFHRKPARRYLDEIEAVYDQTDEWRAHATIELHYNAASSPRAHGLETLRSFTKGGRLLAERVHPVMREAFGLRDRGIKTLKTVHQRGFQSIIAGRAPAILIEPGFGSNKRDALAMEEKWPAFACALVREFAAS